MSQSNEKRMIGKFEIREQLGEGGFGIVNKAVNIEDGTVVAVKTLDKIELQMSEMTQHVHKEVKLLTMLNHSNIVRGYKVLVSKTKIYMVMEYVDGGDMYSLLEKKRRLSEGEAKVYFKSLMECLSYCHARGVYHRDLKLENLLLTSDGQLKVCDFGLASIRTFYKGKSELCTTVVGTEDFSPPEILQNVPYSGDKADMWCAGILLFVMIAGYLPFRGRSPRELYMKIVSCKYSFPKNFPIQARKIIERLLIPKGKDRLSADQVLQFAWFQDSSPRGPQDANFNDSGEAGYGQDSLSKHTRSSERSLQHVGSTSITSPRNETRKIQSSRTSRDEKVRPRISIDERFRPRISIDERFRPRISIDERFRPRLSRDGKLRSRRSSLNLDDGNTPSTFSYSAMGRALIPGFLELLAKMKDPNIGIRVQDRRWRFKTFPKCFLGNEATAWLAENLKCSRANAVEVGQHLHRSGVLHHVCRGHEFEDDFLFYRWNEEDRINSMVLNIGTLKPRFVMGTNPSAIAFQLLNELLAICSLHQSLNDHRQVDMVSVVQDKLYHKFLSSAAEMQCADLSLLANDKQRISFLVNMYNLLRIQARLHIGDFDALDYDQLENIVMRFEYLVGGTRISLGAISKILFVSDGAASKFHESGSRQESFLRTRDYDTGGLSTQRSNVSFAMNSSSFVPSLMNRIISTRGGGALVPANSLVPSSGVDPLVHFLTSDCSPGSPMVRAVSDKQLSSNYLLRSSAEYLNRVLSIDLSQETVCFPPSVAMYRASSNMSDPDSFFALLLSICEGMDPIETDLRTLQEKISSKMGTCKMVVKDASTLVTSKLTFAPRIGTPKDYN